MLSMPCESIVFGSSGGIFGRALPYWEVCDLAANEFRIHQYKPGLRPLALTTS